MLALDTELPFVRHPCPRKRHHPGEQCNCGKRLDIRVPHGYSRASDQGSLHAARLQNLRWRVSAPCPESGAEERPLPSSLGALAEDHRSRAIAKSLRPLSPERQRGSRGGLGRRRHSVESSSSSAENGGFASSAAEAGYREESAGTTVPEASAPAKAAAPRPSRRGSIRHSVSFSDVLETEVPIIAPVPARALLPLPSKRRVRSATEMATMKASQKEQLARANLHRLVANHKRLSSEASDLADCVAMGCCFTFIKVVLVSLFGDADIGLSKADRGGYIV